jgi:hypothetical protein
MMLELLAESALRSVILGGGVWLGLTLLRVRSPKLQMTAWTVVLAASLAMPAVTPWMHVTLPPDLPHAHLVKIAWTNTSFVGAPASSARPSIQAGEGKKGATNHSAAASSSGDAGAGSPPDNHARGNHLLAWRPLAAAVYTLIAGMMMLRLLVGWLVMWRVVRAARPVGDGWAAGADVRVSNVVRVPVTFASTILLPASSSGWSVRKLQAVMLHEGSHVAHCDSYVLLLAAINRAVFWFNPFAWWLLTRLADLAEIISDDEAVAQLNDCRGYADTLLDVARSAQPLPSGLAMARPDTVRRRVARVLAMTTLPKRTGARKRIAAAVAIAPLAALSAVTIGRGSPPPAADQATGVLARTDAARAEKSAARLRRMVESAERFRDQTSAPGAKAAVREMIEGLRRGTPPYERMTPQLAAKMRRQLPELQPMLKTLGATESFFFRGVGPYGNDIYGVKFAHGAGEFRIDLAADGTIREASFRPDGDDTLGGVADCAAEATLRFAEGTAPIRLSLINRSGADVQLFPLGPDGQRLAASDLANNRSTDILTAVERPLVVADQAGQCREVVLPGQLTRVHLIGSLRSGALHGPSAMRRNTPVPGSDETLQRHLEGVRNGAPDYDLMTPDIAAELRQKLPQQREILSRLGALHAIVFRGVSASGSDVYGLRFEHGWATWSIGLTDDGRIAALGLSP